MAMTIAAGGAKMGWHDEWGIPDGQLVRIIGPNYAGDRDDIGTIGQVSKARRGGKYWVRFLNGPSEGKGTTFPSTSLEPVEITASERREGT